MNLNTELLKALEALKDLKREIKMNFNIELTEKLKALNKNETAVEKIKSIDYRSVGIFSEIKNLVGPEIAKELFEMARNVMLEKEQR